MTTNAMIKPIPVAEAMIANHFTERECPRCAETDAGRIGNKHAAGIAVVVHLVCWE